MIFLTKGLKLSPSTQNGIPRLRYGCGPKLSLISTEVYPTSPPLYSYLSGFGAVGWRVEGEGWVTSEVTR